MVTAIQPDNESHLTKPQEIKDHGLIITGLLTPSLEPQQANV
jgi:hypothetical protein